MEQETIIQETIIIEISFAGYLKQYTGHKEPQQLELPQGANAGDAIAFYQIPLRLIKIVNINGYQSPLNTVLNQGDAVTLQPMLLGG